MYATDWVRYLFGQREAIQRVAGSAAALWTGIVLVLLTAVARSYDQTLITENPLLWVFGPLLFSFVSGTWLYLIVYGAYARRFIPGPADPRPDTWSGWRSFMGLFWMTAPIAWLYAVPVERLFDSYSAAVANLVLLGVVSLWRVVLMARVMQVTTGAPFLLALLWVLFAASIEVLVVSFFGGLFAQAIMRGMGGMRNSPEEDLIYGVMSSVFSGALLAAPVLMVIGFFCKPGTRLTPLPRSLPDAVRWKPLLVLALFWIAAAVIPQRELANTVEVEKLLSAGQSRQALDYLSARQPHHFSPGRNLPPKAFERSIFDDLPDCFGVVRADDAPWVRAHLLHRLTEMLVHFGPRHRSRAANTLRSHEQQVQDVVLAFNQSRPTLGGVRQLLEGLGRLPEGAAWLQTNTVFLEGVATTGMQLDVKERQAADWLEVSNRLRQLPLTNLIFPLTNQIRSDR